MRVSSQVKATFPVFVIKTLTLSFLEEMTFVMRRGLGNTRTCNESFTLPDGQAPSKATRIQYAPASACAAVMNTGRAIPESARPSAGIESTEKGAGASMRMLMFLPGGSAVQCAANDQIPPATNSFGPRTTTSPHS